MDGRAGRGGVTWFRTRANFRTGSRCPRPHTRRMGPVEGTPFKPTPELIAHELGLSGPKIFEATDRRARGISKRLLVPHSLPRHWNRASRSAHTIQTSPPARVCKGAELMRRFHDRPAAAPRYHCRSRRRRERDSGGFRQTCGGHGLGSGSRTRRPARREATCGSSPVGPRARVWP